MLDKAKLDAVLVGTRCSLHARMAVKVLQRDLPLYLEKPVATNMDDLLALRDAAAKTKSEVVVSFPLRVTPLVQLAEEIIDSGKIGTVEHVQAWNNVPYGDCYFMAWYRDENETQGLFLQKATHDFDYITYLLKLQPRWICAMNSKRIYKGDRPAGLTCDKCDEWDTCMESPFHKYYSRGEATEVAPNPTPCGFAVDTGNEDSGSAIIEYETGMHASYSQNFFARKKAGARGARFLGYKGTLEFDWYTDELKVFMHHTPRVETYKCDSSAMSHGGGDTVLADNFVRCIRGEQTSVSPLSAGILSVLMCLKAKESAATRTFQEIAFPG
jgi:predicted dehydrogenase